MNHTETILTMLAGVVVGLLPTIIYLAPHVARWLQTTSPFPQWLQDEANAKYHGWEEASEVRALGDRLVGRALADRDQRVAQSQQAHDRAVVDAVSAQNQAIVQAVAGKAKAPPGWTGKQIQQLRSAILAELQNEAAMKWRDAAAAAAQEAEQNLAEAKRLVKVAQAAAAILATPKPEPKPEPKQPDPDPLAEIPFVLRDYYPPSYNSHERIYRWNCLRDHLPAWIRVWPAPLNCFWVEVANGETRTAYGWSGVAKYLAERGIAWSGTQAAPASAPADPGTPPFQIVGYSHEVLDPQTQRVFCPRHRWRAVNNASSPAWVQVQVLDRVDGRELETLVDGFPGHMLLSWESVQAHLRACGLPVVAKDQPPPSPPPAVPVNPGTPPFQVAGYTFAISASPHDRDCPEYHWCAMDDHRHAWIKVKVVKREHLPPLLRTLLYGSPGMTFLDWAGVQAHLVANGVHVLPRRDRADPVLPPPPFQIAGHQVHNNPYNYYRWHQQLPDGSLGDRLVASVCILENGQLEAFVHGHGAKIYAYWDSVRHYFRACGLPTDVQPVLPAPQLLPDGAQWTDCKIRTTPVPTTAWVYQLTNAEGKEATVRVFGDMLEVGLGPSAPAERRFYRAWDWEDVARWLGDRGFQLELPA